VLGNCLFYISVHTVVGVRGGAVGGGTALQAGRSQDWFPMGSWPFPAKLWPWGRLSL